MGQTIHPTAHAIAAHLKNRLDAAGVTEDAAAEALAAPSRSVADWLTGRTPLPVPVLSTLAGLIGETVSTLTRAAEQYAGRAK